MWKSVLKLIFRNKHDQDAKKLRPYVDAVSAFESDFQKLSDQELKAKTVEFRRLLEEGHPLEELLAPAFAVVREASKRVLKMRHFDVQVMGGVVLYQGKIAEMATGEGKTIVATMPLYLHALTGKNVHLVTVNDYLYGLSMAANEIRQTQTIIITEGPFKVMRLWEAGIKNAVAIFGTDISRRQHRLILNSGAFRALIATDNDEAGNDAADKIINGRGRNHHNHISTFMHCERVDLGEHSDIDEMTTTQIQQLFEVHKSEDLF